MGVDRPRRPRDGRHSRQRMIGDMAIRRLAPGTQAFCVSTVAKFAGHFRRSPDLLGRNRGGRSINLGQPSAAPPIPAGSFSQGELARPGRPGRFPCSTLARLFSFEHPYVLAVGLDRPEAGGRDSYAGQDGTGR
jgi:hypothetical protein